MTQFPHSSQPQQLVAEINYIHPVAPLIYDQTHEGRGDEELAANLDRQAVAITNARPLGLSLMEHGVTLGDGHFAFDRYLDDQAIQAALYPQVLNAILRHSGAPRGLIFDHTLRSQTDYGASSSRRAPVKTVHNDYNRTSAELAIRGWSHLERRRYAFINLWMPLFHPVSDSPLAFGDASSFSDSDYHKLLLRYRDRQGQISALSYRPSHRWYYYPDMQPGEALLFKVYDSDPNQPVRLVPHTAFNHPDAGDKTPPRTSLELRSIVFFD